MSSTAAGTPPEKARFVTGSTMRHVLVMAGAGSLMFAVAPECRRLTGLDPESEEVIEAHAEFVARLLVS